MGYDIVGGDGIGVGMCGSLWGRVSDVRLSEWMCHVIVAMEGLLW